jgi:hypothetical protein
MRPWSYLNFPSGVLAQPGAVKDYKDLPVRNPELRVRRVRVMRWDPRALALVPRGLGMLA